MRLGLSTLVWLLIGITTAPIAGLARYVPPTPIASAVLLVNGRTHSVVILNADNVDVRLVHAEYQDMDITKAFDVECVLPNNNRQLLVSARVDSQYHLIPIDIIEYKEYNPSYIKLGIDTIYLRNAINDFDPGDHKIYLDFFVRDRPM
jgi:hypothetical protein